ncbi:unnamed protein product [Scytosiphon promiscuus]
MKPKAVGGACDTISEEERAMAGAPQGNIFDVVVLETCDVPKSPDVSKEIEVRTRSYVS